MKVRKIEKRSSYIQKRNTKAFSFLGKKKELELL